MSSHIEPLEIQSRSRYTVFPIEHHDIFEFYKRARSSFWVPEEIKEELSKDIKNWRQLDEGTKLFIKNTIAFFAVSDGVVNETIANELRRICVKEVQIWYGWQTAIEDIHGEMYSLLAEIYIDNLDERKRIFEAIKNYPVIRRKIDWLHKYVGRDNPFRHLEDDHKDMLAKMANMYSKTFSDFLEFVDHDVNLTDPNAPIQKMENLLNLIIQNNKVSLGQVIIANVIMEGVFFSGSFASIFWINHYHKGLLPGLSKSNEWISRDEGMHCDFAILLYRKYIRNKLPESKIHEMFSEAVNIESDFVASGLPSGLKGMNAELMTQYIQFVADQLLIDLGYRALFKVENPFDFMNKQSVSVRIPDFFIDQNVSEYGLADDNGLRFDFNF